MTADTSTLQMDLLLFNITLAPFSEVSMLETLAQAARPPPTTTWELESHACRPLASSKVLPQTTTRKRSTQVAPKTEWLLTIKQPNGSPICSLVVECESKDLSNHRNNGGARSKAPTADPDARITEPQRRFLFRLLADQGMDGKAAEEHLKDRFKVSDVRDIPRAAASQLIEQTLADKKDGGE